MFAFLHRPLPLGFVAPVIGGALSGLTGALLIIGTGLPTVPIFVTYHVGVAVGAGLTFWIFHLQLSELARGR